jgi:hypothetical protein
MDSPIARGSGRNERRSEKEWDREAHDLLILSGQIGERGRLKQIFTELKQKFRTEAGNRERFWFWRPNWPI